MAAVMEEQPRRRRALKVAGLVLAWVAVAGIAFAAWQRFAAGTVTISTSEPNAIPLTLVGSVNFTDPGTSKDIVLEAVGVSGMDSYASYLTVATGVSSGACAGHITIAGGQAGSWYNGATPSPLSGGATRRTPAGAGEAIQVALAANAPQACANQASVPLEVRLQLVP